MLYFSEIEDYRTYLGKGADFHFNYNANTGGGQSFLGGKFSDASGILQPSSALIGRTAVFQFVGDENKEVPLDDNSTKYEIKPRAAGDNNMKLSVGRNVAPSKAIAAFLMLPETCGVKKASDKDLPPLCRKNFWLQSMWLDADMSQDGIAILRPKDCVFCGGLGEQGGTLKSFTVDFKRRIADLLQLKKCGQTFDEEITAFIDVFAKVYSGETTFNYEECVNAINNVMVFMAEKYPGEYSGLMDPLAFIMSIAARNPHNDNGKPSDLLDTALKLFARQRDKSKADIWPSFDAWMDDARKTFSEIDETKIVAAGFDYPHFVRFVFTSRQRVAFSKFTDAEKQTVGKFIREERMAPHSASWYIDPANKLGVNGVGPAVSLYFMMMTHPDEFATWSRMMSEGLSILGLSDSPGDGTPTVSAYEECKAKQQLILVRMREMGIGRSANDGAAADYLTVNAFLWFVTENKQSIKSEVMKMKLTEPNPAKRNAGKKTWADVLSDNPNDMMNRLIAALLTKPFAILTGASGTGKSRMVRKLAYMTCLNTQLQPDPEKKKPIENFCMVQVKPNWHDSTDLLGYKSAISSSHKYVSTDFVRFILKAHAFPNTPFFICLDEMNLAPVEHYFAEFLSASETAREEDGEFITDPIINPGDFDGDISNLDPTGYAVPSPRKELIERIGLYIPKNLFVVGTVNMDDSTSGFSRKVVDRAMTLEMDEVNYADLQKPSKLALFDEKDNDGNVVAEGVLLEEKQIEAFINRCEFKPENLKSPFIDMLSDLKDRLHQTPLAIAHRFARECVQYRDAVKLLMAEKPGVDYEGFALDHLILMKVLPRLVGNRDELVDLINSLKEFFGKLAGHELSAQALDRMEKAAGRNGGYLSFYP